MLISLLASFTDWDLLTDPQWVGLDNYRDLATDPLFIQSIKVTLTYTAAYVPLDLAGGLLLALLVRPHFKGIGIFRTIFYLPTVFSGVAFVVVWLWMLNPNGGLINLALSWFGIEGPRWLLDPKYALVFAPTDEAFAKLPAGTVESLLKPENIDQLAGIIIYHVVSGRVMAADVVKLTSADTVNGKPVMIKVDGSKVYINDAQVIITDILTSNGVIHVIDQVILPPQ